MPGLASSQSQSSSGIPELKRRASRVMPAISSGGNSLFYSIRHLTRFEYDAPIRENFMEVRSQPRSEGHQRCLLFTLSTKPKARIFAYRDFLGNRVHHFDIPQPHENLEIVARAVVEVEPTSTIPTKLDGDAWKELDASVARGDFAESLYPSTYAQPTPLLQTFAHEVKLERRDDPLSLMRELSERIHTAFAYDQEATEVDSPIEVALKARAGVGQDFAHILIALGRGVGIPCRYVSGYVYYLKPEDRERTHGDRTHAWVEAYLPQLGWVGFDPANNAVANERYIRSAIGRDYGDIPPTRGVFKGDAASKLTFSVTVEETGEPTPEEISPGSLAHTEA